MNLLNTVKGFLKSTGKLAKRHSPTILTALSGAGTLTAVIFAVKDTPKAERLLNKKKRELGREQLTALETVQTCWPVYVPTGAMALMSVACGIGANSIHLRRNAALAGKLSTAYAANEMAIGEYRRRLAEAIGEEAEKEVHDRIVEKEAAPDGKLSKEAEAPRIANGDELFYDEFTKRWFRSDYHTVKRWALDIREEMLNGQMYMGCEEAYGLLGQECPEFLEELGWTADDRFDIVMTEHRLHSGERFTSFGYTTPPHENYYKMY